MMNDGNDREAEPLGKFFIQQKERRVNEFILEKDIK
jgi:hypothetical protein